MVRKREITISDCVAYEKVAWPQPVSFQAARVSECNSNLWKSVQNELKKS